MYDKMARYGTVSCTWHQNHKAPAWPGTSLSPFHLNITPNPTPGWEVVWRWFWDSWDCLFFGVCFMVHSIVDRVEARGKFRGGLATLMYQVQKHSFFTWECWPLEWLLCICGLDCSMRRWSVWTQSLENDCFRVMFWAFWHEALI